MKKTHSFLLFLCFSAKLFGQDSYALDFVPRGLGGGGYMYSPTTEDFPNPERGFMQFTETNSTNYSPLNAAELALWRTLNQPFDADYSIYVTLGYRGFYLESFVNGPISNAYLDAMTQDFAAARQAGVKLVVRFAYTHNTTPPYGDAPKNIVLQHIAQLKPVLMANADVIAVLNMGFIGAWGEGYYTDWFGDDSQPPFGLTTQNWMDRSELLDAMLDAMPPDRSVQVRIPQMKQKAVYGPAATTNAAPLTLAEAWQNTPKARIGFFNDCLMASEDDFGTYKNYDTGVSGPDTANLKPYFAADSRFVPVGGETCNDWNPYSDCNGAPGGNAQNEMARMHFSYLNAGWNNAVNNDWVSGACIEEIKQRLGYRLELQSGEYPVETRPGQSVFVKILLKNKGFAAPFNPRKARLLMRNTTTNAIWQVELPDDARSWLPGNQTHTIEHSFCLPPDIPLGNYELLLHLADPYSALTHRPEYAMRLANENTWEAATGYNKLLHQIAVNNTAGNPTCNGETCFQPSIPSAPNADFLADVQSGCTPLTVTFSNQTSSCWHYQWSFPGGSPATSTEPNPSVVYQTSGTYDVNLTVTSPGGTSSVSKNGYVAVSSGPTVSITTVGGPNFCTGEAVALHATTGLANYQWQHNGTPIGGASSDNIFVYQQGAYWVSAEDSMGCLGISPQILLFEKPEPVASFSYLANGLDVTFTNSSTNATSYSWNFNDGLPASSDANPTHSFPVPGEYYVTLEASNDDCGPVSITLLITVACIPPTVQISPIGNPQICEGDAVTLAVAGNFVTYKWYRDGIEISGAAGANYLATSSGVYQAFVTDALGCGNFSNEIAIEVFALPMAAITSSAPDGSVCEGEAVSLHASGGGQYFWYTPDELFLVMEDYQINAAELFHAGTYFLTVTDNHGCTATATYELTVGAPFAHIQPPGPIAILYGESVTLDAGAEFVSWFWNTGSNTQTIEVSDCGIYSVEVMDTLGCHGGSESIIVYILPSITFLNDTLFSTPAVSYQWLRNGTLIPGATLPYYVPTVTGNYSIRIECPPVGFLISAHILVTIVGVAEASPRLLKIYPNPITEHDSKLNLEMAELGPQPVTLVLNDLAGREFLRKTETHFSGKTFLETAGIQSGAYFVQLWQEGKMLAVGVFLKI
ncbi:MAG: DUF4832 domain-containing protein [Saprospiraceae bacterium]